MACGIGDKECAICVCGDGCLASMHEDFFALASERQLVERLNEGRYPNYRQLMIDTLKKHFSHEYTGYEELPPLPKQEVCCTTNERRIDNMNSREEIFKEIFETINKIKHEGMNGSKYRELLTNGLTYIMYEFVFEDATNDEVIEFAKLYKLFADELYDKC